MVFAWLNSTFLGARVWLWLYLLLSILMGVGVSIYIFREILRKKWYEVRWPEKIIKVIIHYKSNYYKEFWRLIPEEKFLKIESKIYNYSDDLILRENDLLAGKKDNKIIFRIGNKEYQLNDIYQIKNRWKHYPEIHYFFNSPAPIQFEYDNKKIRLSSYLLEEFKKNDLTGKLLSLKEEKNLLTFLMIMMVINLLATVFIIAKMMGWVK